MKHLLYLLFFVAYVHTPFGIDKKYSDIKSFKIDGMSIVLITSDNRQIVVPSIFTVIEEK